MLAGLALLALGAPSPSFRVDISGSGPPVVLIPGLACGGEVWNATVAHLKARHTCYVLTLPGFAGQPAVKPPLLAPLVKEIEAYLDDRGVTKPVLVGHSLGGTLALWLAADAPDRFAGVFSVDGVPYLGALQDPKLTVSSNAAAASQIRAYFAGMKPAAFRAAEKTSLGYMITDPKAADAVLDGCAKSDPGSVGEAAAEMMENDLRDRMSRITCPVTLLMSGALYPNSAALEKAAASYEDQIKAIPRHSLVKFADAKHFIMLDQPAEFFAALDKFLDAQVTSAR